VPEKGQAAENHFCMWDKKEAKRRMMQVETAHMRLESRKNKMGIKD